MREKKRFAERMKIETVVEYIRQAALAVCLIFLSKIVNKTTWDKLTYVVPYMVVVR